MSDLSQSTVGMELNSSSLNDLNEFNLLLDDLDQSPQKFRPLSSDNKPDPMPMELTKFELFGGMIAVRMPTIFVDASNLREIPDNQEVFIDRDGANSIVVDIGERVAEEGIHTDEEAFAFHIEDSIDANDRLCVGSFDSVTMSNLPNVPAYTTVAMTKPLGAGEDAFGKGTEGPIKFTALWMLLLRLEDQNADILITVNVPYEFAEGGKEEFAMATKVEDATHRSTDALKALAIGGRGNIQAGEKIATAGKAIEATGHEAVGFRDLGMMSPFAEQMVEEMGGGSEMLETIISSFQIRDWSLFVN